MKKLTVEELRQVRELVSFSMLYYAEPRAHYKMLAGLGRIFPGSAAQARYLERRGYLPDCLGLEDCEVLTEAFRKCGRVALFRLTKSKSFARLETFTPDGLWLAVAEIVERKRAEEEARKAAK